jgi:DNA polymerase-3 subunit delta'
MHSILKGITNNKRIANAYLFVGGNPDKKYRQTMDFCKHLNCSQKNGCTQCPNCIKISKGIHPDVLTISPIKKNIKIDQIREIKGHIKYGPNASDYLFVIIKNADTLSEEAANSLLKILEEPPEGTVFILLVEMVTRVLPTIASRCQKVFFAEENKILEELSKDSWVTSLNSIKNKSIFERLGFSEKLYEQKESLIEILYNLAFYYKETLNHQNTRLILESIKNIRKNANLKLTLNCLCLSIK